MQLMNENQNDHRTSHNRAVRRRALSALLSLTTACSALCFPPLSAAAAIGNGVSPTVDEAYYVTLDSYGNPTEASIVKSYNLNGAREITDYGSYDAVQNLTDSTAAETGDGTVRFHFGEKAPERFYFEGKTEAPFRALPWTISLSYQLNGVPTEAEKLAGQKGVVKITVKAVPNPDSSEYMKNNWFLTAVSAFNLNDIVSLEAPDAQIQSLGNIRVAAFLWLPGEEQEYTLSVGAEEFQYEGMTFMMGPINAAGRLGDLKDLREAKEDAEDSWDKMNSAMDELLDSLDSMKSNLSGAAKGLDTLNAVRQNVHSASSRFYGDLDSFLGSMDGLSETLKPLSGHLNATNNSVTDLRQNLKDLNACLLALKDDLDDTKSTLRSLSDDMQNLQDVTSDLDRDTHRVKKDVEGLRALSKSGQDSVNRSISSTLSQMTQLYQAYAAYMKSQGMQPMDAIGDGEVIYDLNSHGSGVATPGNAGLDLRYKGSGTVSVRGMEYPEGSFQSFAIEKLTALGYDTDEISYAVALWNYRREVQNASGKAADIYKRTDSLSENIMNLPLEGLYDFMAAIGADGEKGFDQAGNLSVELSDSIKELDQLHSTIDSWIPELQSALNDSAAVCDSLQSSAGSLSGFLKTTRDIMRQNSDQLNDGTRAALQNSSGLLKKSADALESNTKFREAKQSLNDLVDDKWDEHTGDKTNLFRLDADAAAESLTSPQNQNVSTVSVLIRSAEIKAEEEENHLHSGDDRDHRSVLQRIAQMFRDLWHALTGWMKH